MRKNKTLTKFILLATLLSPAMAASNAYDINNLDVQFSMKGMRLESSLDKSTRLSTRVYLEGDLHLNANLKLFFNAGLRYDSASTKSTFEQKRYSANSGPKYKYVYINYEAFSFLNLDVGILKNGEIEDSSPFVTNSIGSMGVRERVKFGNDAFSVLFTAQQARPYNDELVERIGDVETGEPAFFQETLHLLLNADTLAAKATLGHYAYEDLSGDVAAADFYHGNTVTSVDPKKAEYRYQFQGWFYNALLELSVGETKLGGYYSGVKNDKAPNGHNLGSMFGATIETMLLDSKVGVNIGHFKNESDTAPAFYTDSIARGKFQGEYIQLKTEDSEGFKFEVSYADRKELAPDTIYQADEKIIKIGIGKDYDIF